MKAAIAWGLGRLYLEPGQEPDPSNSLKRCASIWDFCISTPKTSGKARPDSRQRKNEQPIRAERKHARAAISTAMSRAAPNAARRQCLPTILRALQSTRNGVAATDSPGALRFWPATSMRSTREGRLGVWGRRDLGKFAGDRGKTLL